MTTIRRTFIILILLAILFFVYRGLNPKGADLLLSEIRTLPQSFFGSGNAPSLSGSSSFSSGFTQTGALLNSGMGVASGSSSKDSIVSGNLFSSGSSLSPKTPISQGKLTIVQSMTGTSPLGTSSGSLMTGKTKVSPPVKTTSLAPKTPVSQASSPSHLSSQELRDTQDLLNHLFR